MQLQKALETYHLNQNTDFLKIKKQNQAKRTKYISKWKNMTLVQKLQILDNLSTEDKIILRNYEDETKRKCDFLQIFPPRSNQNLFVYDNLFERPRYANCLIQAWLFKINCFSSEKERNRVLMELMR